MRTSPKPCMQHHQRDISRRKGPTIEVTSMPRIYVWVNVASYIKVWRHIAHERRPQPEHNGADEQCVSAKHRVNCGGARRENTCHLPLQPLHDSARLSATPSLPPHKLDSVSLANVIQLVSFNFNSDRHSDSLGAWRFAFTTHVWASRLIGSCFVVNGNNLLCYINRHENLY